MKERDGFSWCPVCQYWVPARFMQYDAEEKYRICEACLNEGSSLKAPFTRKEFNYAPRDTRVKCLYCDSTNTENIKERNYKCNECGEKFWL